MHITAGTDCSVYSGTQGECEQRWRPGSGSEMQKRDHDQEDDQDGPKKGYVSPSHSFCESEIDEEDTVNESYSDADNDAMAEIIECKSKKTECDNAVNSLQSSFVDKIISVNYVKEQPVLYLEPVSNLLVSNITEWCTKRPKERKLKSCFHSVCVLRTLKV